MIRLLRQSDGQPVTLNTDHSLGAGGEARVYEVQNDTRLVAKIYHNPTDAIARKLAVMLAHPPEDPAASQGERFIAWPIDLLRTPDSLKRVVGFLMPRVSDRRPIFTFYNPAARRQFGPLSNYRYLHRTGRNLAAAFRALHRAGCVVGDVNETNILASETALVTLVDCDSFQVRAPQIGTVFRCPVGRPEFTPPELLAAGFADADRTPENDHFGLAVLLFQLLMEGTHPFAGIYQGSGDPPAYDERIREGHFVYGTRRVPYRPMPAAPPVEILYPTLRSLFLRAFESGHENPAVRPDTQTWLTALEEAENTLVACEQNAQHLYGSHLPACPWCERTRQLGGRDPFPSLQEVRAGRHRAPAPRRRATLISSSASGAPQSVSGNQPMVWSYSAPPPGSQTPALTPPQNLWPPVAWACLVTSFFPALRFLALGAIVFGIVGLLASRRASIGGRGASLFVLFSALAFVLATVVLPSLLKTTNRTVQTFSGFDSVVRTLAYSPDGKTLAAGTLRPASMSGTRGGLFLLDVRSGQTSNLANYRGDVNAVAFSPDGSRLAVGSMEPLGEGRLQMWDTRNQFRLWEQTAHRDSLSTVAFAPDGKTVASGGFYDYVREKHIIAELHLWDVETGRLQRALEGEGEVNDMAFSPDGRTLGVGTGSGSSSRSTEAGHITLWNIETGKPLWSKTAHSTTILAVAFAPDGRTVASAGNDNAVKLWDTRNGALLRSLEGGGFWIAAVAYSPDGKTVAGGGNDTMIRLWDAASGRLLRSLQGHTGVIQALTFSPDGKTLASASRDGTVKLWRLTSTPAQ